MRLTLFGEISDTSKWIVIDEMECEWKVIEKGSVSRIWELERKIGGDVVTGWFDVDTNSITFGDYQEIKDYLEEYQEIVWRG